MKAVLVFEVDEDVFKELEKTSDLDIRFKYHDTMYVPKEKRIINYSLSPMPKEKHRDTRFDDVAGAIDYGWNSCLAALEGKTMIDKLSDTLDKAIQTAKKVLGEK